MSYSAPDPVLVTGHTYERDALAWHARTAKDRAAWQPSYERFLRLLRPQGRILDLGCGSGEDVPALLAAGGEIVGLDISSRLLSVARQREVATGLLVRGDLRSLPFADGSFDGVWADGSVHHVSKLDAGGALQDVSRVLRAGGAFAISVERGRGEGFVENDGELDGPRWYSRYEHSELRSLLESAGLEVKDGLVADPSDHSTNGFIALFARRK